MDVANGGDGGRTFRVDFSSEGVELLRERIKEKLKEYMGDYTDDTLVEYVIVLLKNGRSKDEARSELNVFLDDDSDSFVSWLWDHLGSNINLYVQARESTQDQPAKLKIDAVELEGRNVSHNLDSDSEKTKPKSSRSCHNRLWKGVVRDAAEQPRLQSSVVDISHVEKERNHKARHEKRSQSPQPVHRKRKQPDERPENKRDLLPQATVDAPRRLLQFAVRDAVATSRPSKLSRESSLKRLSSVVSAPADDSHIEEPPQRTQPLARVPVVMAAVKAVAAKDAKRVRSSGSVFDRLGRASDVADTFNELEGIEDEIAVVGQGRTYSDTRGRLGPYDIRSDQAQVYDENMSAWQSEPRLEIDAEPDEEKYGMHVQTQGAVNISQTGTSGQYKVEDFIINQDSTSYKADKVTDKAWNTRDQSVVMSNMPYKPANASSNLNTWVSPQYQETRESAGPDSRKDAQVSKATISTSSAHMIENNNHVLSANGTAKIEASLQKESQTTLLSAPGSYPANRPMEDADSRTIFVSNVHFAATKDSLLRHFNKFGEVLKVIILTDAATGQPKGSAYVEFMKSEAADSALSLDGTSFMSRLLKVVRKNAAHPEAAASPINNNNAMTRIARGGSPFPAMSRYGSRGVGVGFPRGIPSMYRARFPIKHGARSLQWKRDGQSPSGELPSPSAASVNSPSTTAIRGLTYVRPESKINQSSSAT